MAKDKNGSQVKRLSAESVAILKKFGTMVDTDDPEAWDVNEAIKRMNAAVSGFAEAATGKVPSVTTEPKTTDSLTKTDVEQLLRKNNQELLKAMAPVVQTACDNALQPYVSK